MLGTESTVTSAWGLPLVPHALPYTHKAPPCAQVGLAEMKNAVELSGGMTVQCDSFANPVFRDSLKRAFSPPGEEGHLGLGSNATFEVSRGLVRGQARLAHPTPQVRRHLRGGSGIINGADLLTAAGTCCLHRVWMLVLLVVVMGW